MLDVHDSKVRVHQIRSYLDAAYSQLSSTERLLDGHVEVAETAASFPGLLIESIIKLSASIDEAASASRSALAALAPTPTPTPTAPPLAPARAASEPPPLPPSQSRGPGVGSRPDRGSDLGSEAEAGDEAGTGEPASESESESESKSGPSGSNGDGLIGPAELRFDPSDSDLLSHCGVVLSDSNRTATWGKDRSGWVPCRRALDDAATASWRFVYPRDDNWVEFGVGGGVDALGQPVRPYVYWDVDGNVTTSPTTENGEAFSGFEAGDVVRVTLDRPKLLFVVTNERTGESVSHAFMGEGVVRPMFNAYCATSVNLL